MALQKLGGEFCGGPDLEVFVDRLDVIVRRVHGNPQALCNLLSRLAVQQLQHDGPLPGRRAMQVEIAEQSRSPVPRKPPAQQVPGEFASEQTTDLTFEVPTRGATDADFYF